MFVIFPQIYDSTFRAVDQAFCEKFYHKGKNLKHKETLQEQIKCLQLSVKELKAYKKKSEKTYRNYYKIEDYFRFWKKCEMELKSIFGQNSSFAIKVENLTLPTNEENKVESQWLANSFNSLLGIMEGSLSMLKTSNCNKRYQVFISSTFKDLREYRSAAYDILTSEGHFPAGMENFIATSHKPEEYIKRVIDDSDYYILIIGERYGSIVENQQISFTEMEYNYAKSKGITIIPIIYNGPKKLVKSIDNETMLNRFKTKVCNENTVMWFDDKKSLQLAINQALHEAIKGHPMPGWIRSNKY